MTSSDLVPQFSSSLQASLDRLRQLNTQDIQPQWHHHGEETSLCELFQTPIATQWAIAPLNNRKHIAWDKGRHILWLYQSITIPTDLHGYPLQGLILRLALTWWADDAQIYIDNQLVQSGDLFECFTRLCLSESVVPGQVFQVAIRLVSPGHDNGALVNSQLIYELPAQSPTPEPSFVADELTVLATLEPASQTAIESTLEQLEWNSLQHTSNTHKPNTQNSAANLWHTLSQQQTSAKTHKFQQSLSNLRRTLLPFSEKLKQRTIQCVGHAHLDMAWLWPIEDTWDAAERTFRSILNLQKDFPELTYTHSSPALFEWLENNRPDLFYQIQQKVEEGSWSIDAGLWIEPEFNIISGEAIARHILYGQRYCQEKFGQISKVAWLPDSFGFCWQLPQLLLQGGIETFATLKLSWNDTTEFPYQLFWWQAPDGSRILSIMLPPIGTDIDPIKMSTQAKKWETSTGIPHSLWLPGMGDHGGGPTKDMLTKARRWKKSPFFPTLDFTNPQNYIAALPYIDTTSSFPNTTHSDHPLEDKLPVWKDELYLELHRGCYTSHADQKQQNRHAEDLLYQAEVFATIAQIIAEQPYPKTDLDTAWKSLLFNQFHDILPGTSIPEVFVEANKGWERVRQLGARVLEASLSAIASQAQIPTPPNPKAIPLLIFNSLSWKCSAVVTIQPPLSSTPSQWAISDGQQQVPHQTTDLPTSQSQKHLLFSANNIPPIGYRCFWLYPASHTNANAENPPHLPTQQSDKPLKNTQYVLENKFLKASISYITGQVESLIEKTTQVEVFQAPGNQLQVFQDEGEYWDAWNIAPNYQEKPLPPPQLQSIQIIENGPIRQTVRTIHHFNQSTITQNYTLEIESPILKIQSSIDWKETQTLLKTNFPFTVTSEHATYEIPFGAIQRTTLPKTPAEKAKWEVPALRWADLSNSSFGVSILTGGKHGFDAGPNHLRLTLLKSPTWPDANSDTKEHHFTYAIYPHINSWQSARTVHYAKEINTAPLPHQCQHPAHNTSTHNPHQLSFLSIDNPNVILSAFKPSEEAHNKFVLRCYEAHGEKTNLDIKNTLNLDSKNSLQSTNLLEAVQYDSKATSEIEPWQIKTYCLQKHTE